MKGGTFRNALILRTRRGKFVGKASKFAIVGKRAGGLRPAELRAKRSRRPLKGLRLRRFWWAILGSNQ